MAFLDGASTIYNVRTVHGSPYTFSVKPKWRAVVSVWFFAARSSAEAYLHTSPPRRHSTVGVSKRCEGFVAIWLRPRENIAANHFQLLFINYHRLGLTNNVIRLNLNSICYDFSALGMGRVLFMILFCIGIYPEVLYFPELSYK